MNPARIRKWEDAIKKKTERLRGVTDPKKRTILNLQIQIDQLNIKHERLRA